MDNNNYQAPNSNENEVKKTENQSPQYQYTYSNEGYGVNHNSFNNDYDKKEKKKKRFTASQFIVSLLVVAFLSGGVVYYATLANKDNPEIDTENSTPAETQSPSDSKVNNESDKDTQGSSGINFNTNSSSSLMSSSDNILQTCMNSIVGVTVKQEFKYNSIYGNSINSSEEVGTGSGVIVTADGYIVTNNHVIENGDEIFVYLQDGSEYSATLIGTDDITDLAVIKIDASNLPAAVFGISSDLTVGNWVYAIGNPLGVLTSSVSRGIVSGLDRIISVEGQQMSLIQVDAAVNPGNSGGGLFNENGDLIGIVNSKATGSNVEGIGFAIPIDSAKQIIMDLIDYGFVSGRPYLGIGMQNITISTGHSPSNYFGFPNMFGSYVNRVQVYSVEEGSASQLGGMQVNDIILKFEGEEINTADDLTSRLYEYNIGDVVIITVQRGSETIDLSITLSERTK